MPAAGSRPRRSHQGLFLSTPSARRATKRKDWATRMELISIHALREEGDPKRQKRRRPKSISIHALREEGDHCRCGHMR